MIEYEFEQPTDYNGDAATTSVWLYKDELGLTIDCDINTPRLSGKGVYIHECVIACLPDDEAIKMRDTLIKMYPLGDK